MNRCLSGLKNIVLAVSIVFTALPSFALYSQEQVLYSRLSSNFDLAAPRFSKCASVPVPQDEEGSILPPGKTEEIKPILPAPIRTRLEKEKPASPAEVVNNHICAGLKWGAMGGGVAGAGFVGAILLNTASKKVTITHANGEITQILIPLTRRAIAGRIVLAATSAAASFGTGVFMGFVVGASLGAFAIAKQLFGDGN